MFRARMSYKRRTFPEKAFRRFDVNRCTRRMRLRHHKQWKLADRGSRFVRNVSGVAGNTCRTEEHTARAVLSRSGK